MALTLGTTDRMLGAFRDPAERPLPVELELVLGSRTVLWRRLVQWTEATYGVLAEWTFVGPQRGWVLRLRRHRTMLLTLLPLEARGFRALVVVPQPVWRQVEAMTLVNPVAQAWRLARSCPGGRGLWPEVLDATMALDLELLVELSFAPPPASTRNAERGDWDRGEVASASAG